MGVQINGDTGNISATKADYSGNVTIGGTLTYEDVTNIDSVGLITARNGIEVGARPGVAASVSVDGNAIFSGITTATTLRAPTGIVTSLRTSKVSVGDSPELISVGVGSDLQISHLSDSSYIKHVPASTLFVQSGSNIVLENSDGTNYVRSVSGGAVELYHNGTKKLETASGGVTVTGTLAATAVTGDGSAMTGITTGPYGNYQFSTWYTTSDFNPGAENATIENWAETNAQGYVRLGTAPSYSSGVFTFPSTGYWRIHANIVYYHTTATGDTLTFAIRHSTDSGSSFNNVAATGARLDGSGPSNTKLCWSVTATIKCDNASTNRFDIRGIGLSSTVGRIMGGSNQNDVTSAGCNMHIEKMANL